MEIDFIYIDYIKEQIDKGTLLILHNGILEDVKGLSLSSGKILINLSAIQWKNMTELALIEALPKTIHHEILHTILKDYRNNLEWEENMCQILSNQTVYGMENFKNTTFK